MDFKVLIGSCARGDNNESSDIDILIIKNSFTPESKTSEQTEDIFHESEIVYDENTFNSLYQNGSLFLYHAFLEGQVLSGNIDKWNELSESFTVQKDFRNELEDSKTRMNLLGKTDIFGGSFLTPLIHAHIELKNSCIFYLAHHGIYEFNKSKCIVLASDHIGRKPWEFDLNSYYNYSIRGLDVLLPTSPYDSSLCPNILRSVKSFISELYDACQ